MDHQESRVKVSRRCRLILEVVIMVLRGAQFHRSGPAGCAFLTIRVLSSYSAMFMREQSAAVYSPQDGRMRGGHLIGLYGREECKQFHRGLASYGARG